MITLLLKFYWKHSLNKIGCVLFGAIVDAIIALFATIIINL